MPTNHVNFSDSRFNIKCDYRAIYTVKPEPMNEPQVGVRKGDPEVVVYQVILMAVGGVMLCDPEQLALDPDDPVVIRECEEHWQQQARLTG